MMRYDCHGSVCKGRSAGLGRPLHILVTAFLLLLCLMPVHARAAGYYGKKLKGNARAVYDDLEKAGTSKLKKATISSGSLLKLSRRVSWEDSFKGCYSFLYDHPELYWAHGFMTYGYGGKLAYLKPYNLYYQGISADFGKIDREMNKAIRYVKKKKGRYNKVKAAHDYLDKLVSYGYGPKGGSHFSYAGMISDNGRRMVCAGYAKAFQRICLANGIPCLLVTGQASDSGRNYGSHAWNYVKMSNNKWYLVDCTWDDAGSKPGRTYFLAGSRDKNLWGKTMSVTHKPDKTAYKSGKVTFYQRLPRLSGTRYR